MIENDQSGHKIKENYAEEIDEPPMHDNQELCMVSELSPFLDVHIHLGW